MNYQEIDKKQKQLKPFLNDKSLYKKDYLDHLNVKLTYHSNAIEGNTLSEIQTAIIIEKNEAIGGKSLREHFEAINHYKAFNYLFKRIEDNSYLCEEDILKIHAHILTNIDDFECGKYRNHNVRVMGSNSIFPNYIKVPQLMAEFDIWLKNNQNLHPLQLASQAHYDLVSIHPFGDGNGRTSRLLMNAILMQKNYPPMIIQKEDRNEYIEALEVKRTQNDSTLWDNFVIKCMNNSMDYFLELAKDFNLEKQSSKPKDLER